MLLYGAHVPTTVIPILGTVFSPQAGLTTNELLVLGALYIPFVVMPLLMIYRVTATAAVFGDKVKRS